MKTKYPVVHHSQRILTKRLIQTFWKSFLYLLRSVKQIQKSVLWFNFVLDKFFFKLVHWYYKITMLLWIWTELLIETSWEYSKFVCNYQVVPKPTNVAFLPMKNKIFCRCALIGVEILLSFWSPSHMEVMRFFICA